MCFYLVVCIDLVFICLLLRVDYHFSIFLNQNDFSHKTFAIQIVITRNEEVAILRYQLLQLTIVSILLIA